MSWIANILRVKNNKPIQKKACDNIEQDWYFYKKEEKYNEAYKQFKNWLKKLLKDD